MLFGFISIPACRMIGKVYKIFRLWMNVEAQLTYPYSALDS